MDDKEKLGIADTFVPYAELTNTLNMREKLLQLRREAEAREADARESKESNTLGATSGVKVYAFEKTHVTLRQRIFGKPKKS